MKRIIVAVALLLSSTARAQQPPAGAEPQLPKVEWQEGPVKGRMESATIDLPAGYVFTAAEGAQTMMRLFGNPTSGAEQGLITRLGTKGPDGKESGEWTAVFEFEPVGFVKDDEKDSIDADAILHSLKEGTEASNEERKAMGGGELHVTGWLQPPRYDEKTNNLVWAVNAATDRNETITNYNVKILGRHGVMAAVLMTNPEEITTAAAEFDKVLAGFAYHDGHKYGDYREGDKIAEYGLTGLMLGGAAAIALKSGLLQKFWKVIVIGVIALGAGLKKIFARLKGEA